MKKGRQGFVGRLGARLGARRAAPDDATSDLDELLATSPDALIVHREMTGEILAANKAAINQYGWTLEELRQRTLMDLAEDVDREAMTEAFANQLGSLVHVGEWQHRRKDGTTLWVSTTTQPMTYHDLPARLVIAHDVTHRHTTLEELTHQGTHDTLTGLPNRMLFVDRLNNALARSARGTRSLAVLFCDLDRFKIINDTMGHRAGDALLQAVARRLREAVRQGDTVSRFGGDEFVILAEDLGNDVDAISVAEQLTTSLSTPLLLEGQEIVITASIGIAVGNASTHNAEALLRDADTALYRAKDAGRARHELFDADLRRQARERVNTESALRRALDAEELLVHYQPIVSLDTGLVSGVEVLLRWATPTGELLRPANFLSVAEESGLIVPIGLAMLDKACARAATWHRQIGEPPTLWVNLSARQLTTPGLVAAVAETIDSWLPSPRAIGFEITECSLDPSDSLIEGVVGELAEMGVRIAIDDFGTGYASLSYLWRFPADVIKIDQSFVARLGEDREATVIVSAMTQLARSLGKQVIAEGVETDNQLARLRRIGCDAAQGHLFAAPASAEIIERLIIV